jgi:hypothetical protein
MKTIGCSSHTQRQQRQSKIFSIDRFKTTCTLYVGRGRVVSFLFLMAGVIRTTNTHGHRTFHDRGTDRFRRENIPKNSFVPIALGLVDNGLL